MSDGLMRPIDPQHMRVFRNASEYVSLVSGDPTNFVEPTAGPNVIAGGGNATFPQRIEAGGYNGIAGGYDNRIESTGIGASTIAGGAHHRVKDTATHATVGGGSFGTIKGGSDYSTIDGGTVNTIDGADQSVIGGGGHNSILSSAGNAVIGGGDGNVVNILRGTVGGGTSNVLSGGNGATIGGGDQNAIKGATAGISTGIRNRIGPCRVFIDAVATASDNTVTSATGDFTSGDIGATVVIGGCGANLEPWATTIASINSATSIEVTDAPPSSRSGQVLTLIGTGAAADGASIGGGFDNSTTGLYSRIGGGRSNEVSGNYSATGGGQDNVNGGTWGVVGGGQENDVGNTSWATIAGGHSNATDASGSTISGGASNTVDTSIYGTIGGGFTNSVTAEYATIPGGRDNVADGDYSLASGRYAKADKYGQRAQASGRFAAVGDAQSSDLVLRKQTSNATPAILALDGGGTLLTIADDTTWAFSVLIVARRTDANDESAAYKLEGCIDRNSGTVALVGSVTKTVVAEDTAAWDVAATADNTGKALALTVTGEAAKTINWVARVTLVEVTG